MKVSNLLGPEIKFIQPNRINAINPQEQHFSRGYIKELVYYPKQQTHHEDFRRKISLVINNVCSSQFLLREFRNSVRISDDAIT